MGKRFEVIHRSGVGISNIYDKKDECRRYDIVDKQDAIDLCDLLNQLHDELHLIEIAPKIAELERLRLLSNRYGSHGKACGITSAEEINCLIRQGLYKADITKNGYFNYERIADTDSVIDAAIEKLKGRGE